MSETKRKVTRAYGVERSIGEILYSEKNNSVFANIVIGTFARLTITLVQREDKTYDLFKVYTKNGNESVVRVGRTFPVKNKNGEVVHGITRGVLGLRRYYDETQKKELTGDEDALFITTHRLKEHVPVGENLRKIGYVKGQFGIEILSDQSSKESPEIADSEEVVDEAATETAAKKIPF